VSNNSDFQKQVFARRRKLPKGETAIKQLAFVSPEDIILLKLDWYKQSDCVSERQLADIQGVLTNQNQSLDFEYLKNWAKKLGVLDLLSKAISESEKQ